MLDGQEHQGGQVGRPFVEEQALGASDLGECCVVGVGGGELALVSCRGGGHAHQPVYGANLGELPSVGRQEVARGVRRPAWVGAGVVVGPPVDQPVYAGQVVAEEVAGLLQQSFV